MHHQSTHKSNSEPVDINSNIVGILFIREFLNLVGSSSLECLAVAFTSNDFWVVVQTRKEGFSAMCSYF
jgi:hypothetical protein